jgi:hypothetical protein
LIEALSWLAWLVSAAVAFVLVHRQGWRLVGAMVAGTAAGLLLSLLVMLVTPKDDASYWFQVELTVNGSMSLIFAGAGAALGHALRASRD